MKCIGLTFAIVNCIAMNEPWFPELLHAHSIIVTCSELAGSYAAGGCCRCDFDMMDTPWPGCPAQSVARRIWLNHNSCGRVIDPEDPEYYGSGISQSEWDSSDYATAPTFVLPAGAASGPAGDEYHADSFEAFCYESFPSYDEPGVCRSPLFSCVLLRCATLHCALRCAPPILGSRGGSPLRHWPVLPQVPVDQNFT